MTTATYTFTLSAAQSSASSMVVALRAKTGSSIPGAASRWAGGVMPQLTLNWAAGATTATGNVATAGNSTVDGNAEYEWYKVSSSPSDLTLSTASLPTVAIIDDDTAGGGDMVVYGPTTTGNTGYQPVGSAKQRISGTLSDQAFSLRLASNAAGTEGVEVRHDGERYIVINVWTAGTPTTIQQTNRLSDGALSANTSFTLDHDPSAGTLKMIVGGSTRLNNFGYGTPKTDTYASARFDNGNQSVTMTRLA